VDQLWHIVLAWIAAMAIWILTTAALLVLLPDPDAFTHPAVSIGTAVWAATVGIGVYLRLHRRTRDNDRTGAHTNHTHPAPTPGHTRLAHRRRHLRQSIALGGALLTATVIGYGIAITAGYTPDRGDAALPFLLICFLYWAIHQLHTIDHFPTNLRPPQHRTP
jgi:cobalamin biosynthesis protein CobD/CbiB